MAENYAFIGLGAMGYAMAKNIRQKIPKESTLYINDINAAACERFTQEFGNLGPITTVSTARDAVENSKVIFSIVPGAADVKKVYLDEKDGVIAAKEDSDRVLCECSTIDVKSTREVGEAIKKAGRGTYVDTPVSGGVPAADRGDLAMLIGHPSPAEDATSQLLVKVISMIGEPKKFFYCGPLGAGLTAKISNNYLSGTILLATAEAFAIGIKSGMDPHVLYQVIKASTGQSWMCDHVCPVPGVVPHVPSSNNYKPGFKTQMMIKDMSLGVNAGYDTGIKPVMAEAAIKIYETASEDPQCIDRDGSSVYLHIGGPVP